MGFQYKQVVKLGEHQKVWGSRFFGYLGKPYLSVQTMTAPPTTLTPNYLAVGYQLKLHLLSISPQISRRVLMRGDTTLAKLHHVF
jgi:hypothetical protein